MGHCADAVAVAVVVDHAVDVEGSAEQPSRFQRLNSRAIAGLGHRRFLPFREQWNALTIPNTGRGLKAHEGRISAHARGALQRIVVAVVSE
jgi:hypothetical protein